MQFLRRIRDSVRGGEDRPKSGRCKGWVTAVRGHRRRLRSHRASGAALASRVAHRPGRDTHLARLAAVVVAAARGATVFPYRWHAVSRSMASRYAATVRLPRRRYVPRRTVRLRPLRPSRPCRRIRASTKPASVSRYACKARQTTASSSKRTRGSSSRPSTTEMMSDLLARYLRPISVQTVSANTTSVTRTVAAPQMRRYARFARSSSSRRRYRSRTLVSTAIKNSLAPGHDRARRHATLRPKPPDRP